MLVPLVARGGTITTIWVAVSEVTTARFCGAEWVPPMIQIVAHAAVCRRCRNPR